MSNKSVCIYGMCIPDRRAEIGENLPVLFNMARRKMSCSGLLHYCAEKGQDMATSMTGEFKKLIYGGTLK